jgi:diadenosine tetraphosphate (Ap4A) HIT family hydrolase
LAERRDAGDSPQWDRILRTPEWDLVHAYDSSIEGWLVLVATRHITALADMTDAEAAALGPLVKAASAALRDVVGCVKTYIVQFAEHPLHPHVHVHVIPRAHDLPEASRGPHVFQHLGVTEELRVPEMRMNEIAAAVAARLADVGT